MLKKLATGTIMLGLVAAAGCTSRVDSPAKLPRLSVGASPGGGSSAETHPLVEPIDMVAEEKIAGGCLEAWRKALAGDEQGAMTQLADLEKQYPKAVTVRFMMGQVLEHCGKKDEAVKYYREAVSRSQFSSMYTFKLAESLRTTGDAKGAIPHYRSLVELRPDFVAGRVGLARSLYEVDKESAEAREQLQRALDLDPKNQDALSFQAELDGKKSR